MEERNYPLWLIQLTNQRLGEQVIQTYTYIGVDKIRSSIGNTYWDGVAGTTEHQAKNNAALAAYVELVFMPEKELRTRLGIPPRPKIKELSELRGSLNKLGCRIEDNNNGLTAITQNAARDRLGYLMHAVDAFEQQLLCFGFKG